MSDYVFGSGMDESLRSHALYNRTYSYVFNYKSRYDYLAPWRGQLPFYFIPISEFSAYLKQIKVILSGVKKYRIFLLVTNTIYIFSLKQTEAVSTI